MRSMELVESEKTEGMKAGCISGEGIPYSRNRRIIRVFHASVTQSCPSPLAEGAQGPEVSDSNLYLQTSAQKIEQNPDILMILQDFFCFYYHTKGSNIESIYTTLPHRPLSSVASQSALSTNSTH